MPRPPIPTWAFVLVIVRSGDRFLLIHESRHGNGWYLPAGRVEPGEPFAAAAVRETREETGVPVVLDGIVRIEHTPNAAAGTARLRVIFAAHPQDDTPPKRVADSESLEADWFTREQARELPLRGTEILGMLRYVAEGGPIYPLSLIDLEGLPFDVEDS